MAHSLVEPGLLNVSAASDDVFVKRNHMLKFVNERRWQVVGHIACRMRATPPPRWVGNVAVEHLALVRTRVGAREIIGKEESADVALRGAIGGGDKGVHRWRQQH